MSLLARRGLRAGLLAAGADAAARTGMKTEMAAKLRPLAAQTRGLAGGARGGEEDPSWEAKRKERRDRRRQTSPEFKQPLTKYVMQLLSNGATVQVPNLHPEAFPVWRVRTDVASGPAWMSPKAREAQTRAAEERRKEKEANKRRR